MPLVKGERSLILWKKIFCIFPFPRCIINLLLTSKIKNLWRFLTIKPLVIKQHTVSCFLLFSSALSNSQELITMFTPLS